MALVLATASSLILSTFLLRFGVKRPNRALYTWPLLYLSGALYTAITLVALSRVLGPLRGLVLLAAIGVHLVPLALFPAMGLWHAERRRQVPKNRRQTE
jgi:hypothetical protein